MKQSGYIPDSVIDDIRLRADIGQIIGEVVALKKAGRRLVGLCPFHKDSHPSFYVNPERGAFKCFGCGVGGDVFRFVMETQRLDFPEAVRHLANRFGIEVPEATGTIVKKGYRDRLFTANDAALSFFRQQLAHNENGKAARDYLSSRQVSAALVDRFELGYAPEAWDKLANHLLHKGISAEDAEAAGVIAPREKGGGYYDRFRHRLMFPVRNTAGKVVAFSGRLLSGDGPKYINSPESEIYSKSKTFYGLHVAGAAIGKADMALVCEGNFDVISFHQFGFTTAIAALGTAFTELHANVLDKYTKRITFVFDGDEAGQKAMVRLLDIYLQREEQPQVVVLPKGEDPDSFLKAFGENNFKKLLEQAPFLLDFALDRIFTQHSADDEGITQSLNEACKIVARLNSPIRRGLQAKRLATRTNVAEDMIRQQIDRLRRGSKAAPVIGRPSAVPILPTSERTILATLLHYPQLRSVIDKDNVLMALPEGPMRIMAERIIDVSAAGKTLAAEDLIRPDDEEEICALAGDLLMSAPPCEAKTAAQALDNALADRERRKLTTEIDSVKRQLQQVVNGDNSSRYAELEGRLFALRKRLQELRS